MLGGGYHGGGGGGPAQAASLALQAAGVHVVAQLQARYRPHEITKNFSWPHHHYAIEVLRDQCKCQLSSAQKETRYGLQVTQRGWLHTDRHTLKCIAICHSRPSVVRWSSRTKPSATAFAAPSAPTSRGPAPLPGARAARLTPCCCSARASRMQLLRMADSSSGLPVCCGKAMVGSRSSHRLGMRLVQVGPTPPAAAEASPVADVEADARLAILGWDDSGGGAEPWAERLLPAYQPSELTTTGISPICVTKACTC